MLCPSQPFHTPSPVFWALTFHCELDDINLLLCRALHICNPLTMWQKGGKGVSPPPAQDLVSAGDKTYGRIIHETVRFPKIHPSPELKPGHLLTGLSSQGQSLHCSRYWGFSREYTISPIYPIIFQISESWVVSLTTSFQLCSLYSHNHSFHLGAL